ncbi:MAG: glutathione S-transferase family protein [Proteobacteria bacterium]|nr:glutathione S-transferase family protein [Pseudomonadota bacterium]MCH8975998.1 glutathione S-transferase family protein [Pseudomonadota bacterium]
MARSVLNEANRLYGVMNNRLEQNEYLAGDFYSIADVATYPWTMPKQQALHRIDINRYPNVKRWNETIALRTAVEKGIAVLAEDMKVGDLTDEAFDILSGARQQKRC